MQCKIETLIASRVALLKSLSNIAHLGLGSWIGSNDANFVVIPVLSKDGSRPDNVRAQKVYKTLAEENGVVVRFRGNEPGCEGCLRITIGSEEENATVVQKLEFVLNQF